MSWVLTQIPLPPEAPQAQTTILYDATGAQLATLHGVENRFPVSIDQVPQVLVAAVVSAEDRKFFEHGGIDPLGIARATWQDVRHKGVTQGGSTITQQYVKNAYVGQEYTLWRKIREAVISVKIERKLNKQQILERYLNTVYFGRGAYGVQAAAKAYYNTDVGQLGLKESAYLAGLIRSPSAGDVVEDPVEAHDLRFLVLQSMVQTSVITAEQANEAESVPVADYVIPKPSAESTCEAGCGCTRRSTPPPSASPTTRSTACSTARPTPPAPWFRWTTRAGWWPWSAAGTGTRRRSTWPWAPTAAGPAARPGRPSSPLPWPRP